MATTFGERLKLAMRNAEITQAEMAEKLGITQQSVQFACSNKSKSSKHTERMAAILGVTASWLAFGSDIPEPQVDLISKAVPLYNIKQLSKGERTAAHTPCPFHCGPNTYAFTVEGMAGMASAMHPMYGRAYPVGSIVFVDPDQANTVQHNDVVAVMLTDDNAFTFRVLLREAGRDTLMPLNPQFPTIDPSRPFTIIGKVIGAILQ